MEIIYRNIELHVIHNKLGIELAWSKTTWSKIFISLVLSLALRMQRDKKRQAYNDWSHVNYRAVYPSR